MRCPNCKKDNSVKMGMKVTASGPKQRYYCKQCYRIFM